MILGVIPARGGSQRIPRKNLAMVAGKPLIVWTLESTLAVRGLDAVVVSTDDEEIAAVARQYGVNVLRRPAALAASHVPDLPVFQHVLSEQRRMWGYDDLIVHLRPTAPLRTARDIEGALMWIGRRWISCLRSVRRVREHPAKMFRPVAHDPAPWAQCVRLEPFSADHRPNDPSQFLAELDMPTGFLDIIRAPFIAWYDTMTGPAVAQWFVPPERDLDIDEPQDLAEAERRLTWSAPWPWSGRPPSSAPTRAGEGTP